MIDKLSYYKGRWGGESEILLEELRKRGIFEDGFTGSTDASPYWYGTILNFETLYEKMPLIKKERLAEIAEIYINSDLSPIVRLLGLSLKRKL